MKKPKSNRLPALNLDLLDLVDHNAIRRQILSDLLDNLEAQDRDLIANRYGLLDYETDTPLQRVKVFKELAVFYGKSERTIIRKHNKALENLRTILITHAMRDVLRSQKLS